MRRLQQQLLVVLIGLTAVSFSVVAANTEADPELEQKIQKHKTEIQKLDEEITKYERELQKVSRKRKTLSNLMRQIDLSRRRLNASVKKTKRQITDTQRSIQELEADIEHLRGSLSVNKEALARALKELQQQDDYSLVEVFLRNERLSDLWGDVEALRRFQSRVGLRVQDVTRQKKELEEALAKAKQKHEELIAYQEKLAVQKQSLEISRQEKARILKQTKNKESEYQRILAEKRAARERFEKALRAYEAKLTYKKTGTLPKKGSKVFSWPLDYIHITQYFGNTRFARSGAYNGQGHNGLDLGTPLGSPVKAPADGTVMATGNTDAYPGCLSYGKWVLIKHDNGLATMYAHLSKIATTPGTRLKRGQVFAYSGSSGYSTGPHLHFGVYDASAVKVVRIGEIRQSKRCSQARIPIAPWKAYFNPLDFLP